MITPLRSPLVLKWASEIPRSFEGSYNKNENATKYDETYMRDTADCAYLIV